MKYAIGEKVIFYSGIKDIGIIEDFKGGIDPQYRIGMSWYHEKQLRRIKKRKDFWIIPNRYSNHGEIYKEKPAHLHAIHVREVI